MSNFAAASMPDAELDAAALASIHAICQHPQLANYRRDARGRRGAIYIPAAQQQSLQALHTFSSSPQSATTPRRCDSLSG